MARKQNKIENLGDLAISIHLVYKVNSNTSNNYFLASPRADIVISMCNQMVTSEIRE